MSRIRTVSPGNRRAWLQKRAIHVGEMFQVRLIVAAAQCRIKSLKRVYLAEIERRRRLEDRS